MILKPRASEVSNILGTGWGAERLLRFTVYLAIFKIIAVHLFPISRTIIRTICSSYCNAYYFSDIVDLALVYRRGLA